ncbi:DNA gyrase subunit B [Streptomyces sp. NPDC093094]|uniref:DNA gyrase subunit B n=1 Tax=Streptomyces sp. NPDC093094 TaxID=3366026 RepID=UPI003809FB78
MSKESMGYDAAHIEVLEARASVRRRPGMFVGSTGERGLRVLVFEVAERPVNDVLAGRARSVGVTLTADGRVRVHDDGPGVPVEAAGHTGGPGLETELTRMRGAAGPGSRRTLAMSLFGVGPFVTNALSSRLTAEVRRDGVRWVQEYARGEALAPPTAAGPADTSGTTITFRPDAGIFESTEFSYAPLAQRFRELAFLYPELDITLTDERHPDGPRSERFRFPGGIRDLVAFLDAEAGEPLHQDIVVLRREDPRTEGTIEAALRWSDAPGERIQGFVNSLPTHEGGTHLDGLRDGVVAALGGRTRADQVLEGLTAVVSVKLDRPDLRGATRSRLADPVVRTCVAEAVREHLGAWLEEHPRQAASVTGRPARGTGDA